MDESTAAALVGIAVLVEGVLTMALCELVRARREREKKRRPATYSLATIAGMLRAAPIHGGPLLDEPEGKRYTVFSETLVKQMAESIEHHLTRRR